MDISNINYQLYKQFLTNLKILNMPKVSLKLDFVQIRILMCIIFLSLQVQRLYFMENSQIYLKFKTRDILNSYNNIQESDQKKQKLMLEINLLRSIGMALFFIKFYIFIGFTYTFNFIFHLCEKLVHGNSKKVICPYKNTHPDVFLQIEQLIKLDGFTIEQHQFETLDKAYVTLWRVRRDDKIVKQSSYPILIMHGLLDCSISWFLHQNKQNCLPYILAKQGYDVWVGNNRGTKHSMKNSHEKNYWDFNFDHFVQYDQPTLINSVLKQTNKQKLIYIGHSQGSTQFLVSTGVHHDIPQKIACFIGMGTVISLQNVDNHTVLKYLGKFRAVQFLRMLGFKTVLCLPKWVTKATGILIYNTAFYFNVFFGIVNLLCGTPMVNKINKERLGVIISHEPGGASIPNVLQWVQFHRSKKFAKFDYGKKKNLELYGTQFPPQYLFSHLKSFNFNSYIFKGSKDAVISDKDFAKIKEQMHLDKLKVIEIDDYAHLDYVWGVDAHKDIYEPIIDILNEQSL